ncbi:MAG: hypothetical protein N3A67_05155 [Ignavibacteria bacterium]|nr:hypothetical protein [Ignavibacteria bacterium]
MLKILYLIMTLAVLSQSAQSEPLRIAISKGSGSDSYLRYGEWLKSTGIDIEIVDMISYSPDEAAKLLETCKGLVL